MTFFLAGVHRSGTNMIMNVLQRSIDTDVFHESDPRAFDNYMMRNTDVILALINRSPAQRIVIKSMHEAHRLRELMNNFSPSKCIWVFRRYDDVINSIMTRWPGYRNCMDEIITKRHPGHWRGAGMKEETSSVLASLYHEGMNDATITALFWYQRNQLLFDQRFHMDRNCALINYDRFVTHPHGYLQKLCAFLDITYSERMTRIVHGRSIGKLTGPDIEPEVRAVCDRLYGELLEAWRHQN